MVQNRKQNNEINNQNQSHFDSIIDLNWRIVTPLIYNVLILNFVVLTVDRFIAIHMPLRYPNLVTTKRAILCCALIAVYSTMLSLLPMMGWNSWSNICRLIILTTREYTGLLLPLHIFGTLIIITILYAIVFTTVHKQRRKILDATVQGQEVKRQFSSDCKAAINLMIIILVYAVCYLPFCVICVKNKYSNHTANNGNISTKIAVLAVYINSGMNPIIYSLRMTSFRMAFKHILTCKRE